MITSQIVIRIAKKLKTRVQRKLADFHIATFGFHNHLEAPAAMPQAPPKLTPKTIRRNKMPNISIAKSNTPALNSKVAQFRVNTAANAPSMLSRNGTVRRAFLNLSSGASLLMRRITPSFSSGSMLHVL